MRGIPFDGQNDWVRDNEAKPNLSENCVINDCVTKNTRIPPVSDNLHR